MLKLKYVKWHNNYDFELGESYEGYLYKDGWYFINGGFYREDCFEPNMKNCLKCDGSGWNKDKKMDCIICNGKGKIRCNCDNIGYTRIKDFYYGENNKFHTRLEINYCKDCGHILTTKL